jgi:hypothetical protein
MIDRASTEPRVTNFDPNDLDRFSENEDEDAELKEQDSTREGEEEEEKRDQEEHSPGVPAQVNVSSAATSVASLRKSTGKKNKKRNNPLMDDDTVDIDDGKTVS